MRCDDEMVLAAVSWHSFINVCSLHYLFQVPKPNILVVIYGSIFYPSWRERAKVIRCTWPSLTINWSHCKKVICVLTFVSLEGCVFVAPTTIKRWLLIVDCFLPCSPEVHDGLLLRWVVQIFSVMIGHWWKSGFEQFSGPRRYRDRGEDVSLSYLNFYGHASEYVPQHDDSTFKSTWKLI